MSSEDLKSMKVAELKKQLQMRKLPVNGTKAELIERLEIALDDEMLKDTDDVKGTELTENAQAPAETTEKAKPSAKKTAASKPAAKQKKVEQPKTTEAVVKKKDEVAIPIPVNTEIKTAMTAEEKAALRAQRFGIVDPEVKKRERAKRFGIDNGNDPDKLEQRAKRFGLVTDSQKQDKLNERAKRFGLPDPLQVEEMKRKRMERFGVTKTLDDEIKAKKSKRQQRFNT